MLKTFLLITALTALSSCATLDQGETQSIIVDTINNTATAQTKCTLTNEEGQWVVIPNNPSIIHRDGNEMAVECSNPGQQGKISIAPYNFHGNLLMVDLFLDICLISCAIDGYKNSWFSYPETIPVPMFP